MDVDLFEHEYISTACLHGRCRDCRKTCKWCPARCQCPYGCHQPEPPTGRQP